MHTVGKYTLVRSIKELTDGPHRDRDDDIYVDAVGMFFEARKVTYPHVFIRSSPLGPRYAPQYHPCGNDEMLQVVRSKIDALQFDINYYKELLNAFTPCEKENNHD